MNIPITSLTINLRHMKIIYLSLLTMFFFGCISQPKTELDSLTIPILDISKEYPEVKVDIHELGKVEYIPLETTDESVMATGWHNCISDKYIIMKDLSRVHLFNREGKHLYSFEHSGQGPKEYHYISELYTDFENKEIYIADPKKIQVYSFSGEWIRTLGNIPKGINIRFTFNADKQYLITNNVFHDYFNVENLPLDLTPYYLIDKLTGEFIPLPLIVKDRISRVVYKGIKDISKNIAEPIIEKIPIEPMLANGSDILIADFGLDTLYSYKNNRLIPIAVKYPSVHDSTPPVVIAPTHYTDQFLIFQPIEMKYDSKYVLQPMADAPFIMWNRKSNSLHRIKLYDSNRPEKNIKWDMKRVQFENPNHIRIIYTAEKLCEDYENGKLKGELKEVASRLTEEDNYVVAICKLED